VPLVVPAAMHTRHLSSALLLSLSHFVSACGDGDDFEASELSRTAGGALCSRAAKCSGESPPVVELEDCARFANRAFGTVLPDPDGTVACINAGPCDQLENNPEPLITGCIDLDPSSVSCSDDNTLHLCNNSGVCRDADCRTACSLVGTSHVGCGFSDADGYDQCLCGR